MRKRLGDVLIESGLITQEQLEEVLKLQKKRKLKLGQLLINEGYLTKEQITEALSAKLNIPIIQCHEMKIDDTLKQLVPKEIALPNLVFPVEFKNNVLTIAMADPLDYKTIDDIAFKNSVRIKTVMSYDWSIKKAIEDNYEEKIEEAFDAFSSAVEEINVDKELQFSESKDTDEIETSIESLYSKSNFPPVVKLVAMVIADATSKRASDIHIEPREKYTQIRFRIDGEMRHVLKYDKSLHDSVISRVKIISGLDITNRRLPQDGGAQVTFKGKTVDLRISTVPTVYGEKIVIRLLDQSVNLIPIEELGMPDDTMAQLIEVFKRPQGMLLVTGPTGSGKTTTLYASINQLRSDTKNMITIEDPVEYKLQGITQIPVKESIGRTFASILRSVLRQDPDVVMVGEIRDFETAEIAVKAALTGHLVLSTLHTNNTIATISRLLDIGIAPYLLSSALSAIIAQRLVRRLCNYCKTEEVMSEEKIEMLGSVYNICPDIKKTFVPVGCPKCSNSGFMGRVAVYEFLPITTKIRRLIARNASDEDIFEVAKEEGVRFLFDEALNKVRSGVTSLDEVIAKIPMDYYTPTCRIPVNA
ncbi:MAG: ATPase, T2SS/T4P/T4SS family [Thermodesulfovibrionales bacterium]|nr:ATPase, T2SS/T4P/T4SS family [Thermodesulfovibrionales bacterium]